MIRGPVPTYLSQTSHDVVIEQPLAIGRTIENEGRVATFEGLQVSAHNAVQAEWVLRRRRWIPKPVIPADNLIVLTGRQSVPLRRKYAFGFLEHYQIVVPKVLQVGMIDDKASGLQRFDMVPNLGIRHRLMPHFPRPAIKHQ